MPPSKPSPSLAGGRSSGSCGATNFLQPIAARFDDVTRSAISQHLGVLREAALVIERRDGTRRLYRANQPEMLRLRQFLDDYWTGSLQRLQSLAESAEREKGTH